MEETQNNGDFLLVPFINLLEYFKLDNYGLSKEKPKDLYAIIFNIKTTSNYISFIEKFIKDLKVEASTICIAFKNQNNANKIIGIPNNTFKNLTIYGNNGRLGTRSFLLVKLEGPPAENFKIEIEIKEQNIQGWGLKYEGGKIIDRPQIRLDQEKENITESLKKIVDYIETENLDDIAQEPVEEILYPHLINFKNQIGAGFDINTQIEGLINKGFLFSHYYDSKEEIFKPLKHNILETKYNSLNFICFTKKIIKNENKEIQLAYLIESLQEDISQEDNSTALKTKAQKTAHETMEFVSTWRKNAEELFNIKNI